jgi:hypothetical protein
MSIFNGLGAGQLDEPVYRVKFTGSGNQYFLFITGYYAGGGNGVTALGYSGDADDGIAQAVVAYLQGQSTWNGASIDSDSFQIEKFTETQTTVSNPD